MDYISFRNRRPPLVLTLDIGSSSVRCGVYDSHCRAIEGMDARQPLCFDIGRDGSATIDPRVPVEALFQCIDQVLERLGPAGAEIVGVGCCTFVTNVMGLDSSGNPVTPVTTYADTASWNLVNRLAGELDQEATRQRVGCYFHPSYLPAQLLFWKENRPETYNRVAHWVSLGEYIEQILFGRSGPVRVTHSVASWTGLLNRHTLDWDDELLDYLALDRDSLSPLCDVSFPRAGLLPEFSTRWPGLRDIPWYPAIGDGVAANLGSAKPDTPQTLVISLGSTSAVRSVIKGPVPEIPEGLWCYRVDGRRSLIGGALTEGGNVHAWLLKTLRMDEPDSLDREIAGMPPDSHGLTVLPLFAGERSPGWRGQVPATIHGLSFNTSTREIMRASMESVTIRIGMVFNRVQAQLVQLSGLPAHDIPVVAGGGALNASPAWAQMLADVLGQRVELCGLIEPSSRGLAILVMELLGEICWENISSKPGVSYDPDSNANEIYCKARDRQIGLYNAMAGQGYFMEGETNE